MKINKKKLMAVLEKVKPGLASKDIVSQATSFAFSDGYISTFNDEIAISAPFESEIEGAVRANELYALLSKVYDDELDVTTKGNELIIKGKKAKAGIKLETEITLPIDELGDTTKMALLPLPEDFLDIINIASQVAAKDMSKPILTCVFIEGEMIYASDGGRIIRGEMNGKIDGSILLPAAVVKTLLKYNVTEFGKTQGWVHFHTEDELIFSSRVLVGDFPEVDEYLEVEGDILTFPKTIISMLDRAGVFTAENISDEFVTISVENKKMIVKGEGEFGWLEETTNCRYQGDKVEFSVDPAFLVDIVEDLKKCVVGENTLLFQGENFDHVISLFG